MRTFKQIVVFSGAYKAPRVIANLLTPQGLVPPVVGGEDRPLISSHSGYLRQPSAEIPGPRTLEALRSVSFQGQLIMCLSFAKSRFCKREVLARKQNAARTSTALLYRTPIVPPSLKEIFDINAVERGDRPNRPVVSEADGCQVCNLPACDLDVEKKCCLERFRVKRMYPAFALMSRAHEKYWIFRTPRLVGQRYGMGTVSHLQFIHDVSNLKVDRRLGYR